MKKIFTYVKKILKKAKINFLVRLINDLYHYFWYRKLYHYFIDAEEKMVPSDVEKNSEYIWVFWWQGLDSMPKIVRACYESICFHSNGHKVVLVTKENFRDYTNIDENILNLLENNKISLTAFSDVLRFNLLYNNGGLWMDSTLYVTEDIPDYCFDKMFTVGIDDRKYHDSVNGSYSIFLFGGFNNKVINFIDEFYKIYFKNNDKVNYYFTTDVALNYCYKNNIDGFRDYVDNFSFNSEPYLNSLIKIINDNFSDKKMNEIKGRFYKLSYKVKFDENKDSFYNHLVKNKNV